MSDHKRQLIELFEHVSGCEISEFSEEQLPYLADYIIGQAEADSGCIDTLKRKIAIVTAQRDELLKLNTEFADFAKRQGWQHVLIDDHFKLIEELEVAQELEQPVFVAPLASEGE